MRTILTSLTLLFVFLNAMEAKHHYTFYSIVSLSAPEAKDVQFAIEAHLDLGDRCQYIPKINAFEVISEDALDAFKIKNALNKRGYFIHLDAARTVLHEGNEKSTIHDEEHALRKAWFALHHQHFNLPADAPVEILSQKEFDGLHPEKRDKIQAIKTIIILP